MAWSVDEINFQEDMQDWAHKVKATEKNLLTNILKFFTQGDIIVFDAYLDKFIPVLGGHPEVKYMMTEFAASETEHVIAYSKLLETLGFPDSAFEEFKNFKEMSDKIDYLEKFDPSKFKNKKLTFEQKQELALTLAVYSGFMEGISLFSSFVMLLSFQQRGLMKSMGRVVEWSVKDEGNHVEGMTWLFREFIRENPEIWTDEFKAKIYQACRDFVDLEDNFIDLSFKQCGELPNLTPEQVKAYVRYVANRRLNALGLKDNYDIVENPISWMEWVLMSGHHNFFETRSTEYVRGAPENYFDGFDALMKKRDATKKS